LIRLLSLIDFGFWLRFCHIHLLF